MPLKHTTPPDQLAASFRRSMKALPVRIANTAHNFFLDNFRKQGWQGDHGFEPWKKRAEGAPRNQGRAILVNRGVLRRSMTKYVTGYRIRIAVTGPAEKYAGIHNEGGTLEPTVTKAMRAHFFKLYKATGNKKYLYMATTKKKKLHIAIPKRRFIGNSAQLNTILRALITERISQSLK